MNIGGYINVYTGLFIPFVDTQTALLLLCVGAGSFMYVQGRSSHLPIPTLRFSCFKLGPSTGLSPLCRKNMAFWSAGPKCGNYFHAAESGRRCDEMLRRYQCAVLAPCEAGQLGCRMVCFLRHRGLSPVSPSHLRNFVETAPPTLRSYGQFAQRSGAFDLPIRKLSFVRAIRVGIGTGRLRDLAIRKWEPVSTKFRRFVGLPVEHGAYEDRGVH
jgi:hypothetical protein